MDEQRSLPLKMVSASKWSILSEVGTRTIAPLSFLVLANFLTPDDFGIVALATMMVSFAQILWDSGMSKALIQRAEDIEETANIVFFGNIFLALAVYVIIFFAARSISIAFEDPRLMLVARVQGLQILIGSSSSVHAALLQRNFDFKALFRIRIITSLLAAFISIALVFFGSGYWALIVGVLISEAVRSFYLWKSSSWRPMLAFDRRIARSLLSFGSWVLGEEILAWLIACGDSIIVAYYLGAFDLGVYRVGTLMVLIIYGILLEPLVPVIFSFLSRVQGDTDKFSSYLDVLTRFFSVVSLPLGFCIFVLATPAADVFLDQAWRGIDQVISYAAINLGLSYIVSAFPPAFRAQGKVSTFAKMRILSVLYFVPAYVLSIQFGMLIFLYTRIAVTIVTILLYGLFSKYFLDYSLKRFFGNFLPGAFWALWVFFLAASPNVFKPGILGFWSHAAWVFTIIGCVSIYIIFRGRDRQLLKQIISLSLRRG